MPGRRRSAGSGAGRLYAYKTWVSVFFIQLAQIRNPTCVLEALTYMETELKEKKVRVALD